MRKKLLSQSVGKNEMMGSEKKKPSNFILRVVMRE